MDVVHPVCGGVDVHKDKVTVSLVKSTGEGKPEKELREFQAMTRDVLAMGDWLSAEGCTHIAMESTGVYWKPIFNLLEGQFKVLLINAQHIKAVPGRKTDVSDAEWIADLLRHGLLRGSFIPPVEIRDLREWTRRRQKLTSIRTSEVNRIHKVLQDANVKLSSVATDILGVSGRKMLDAIVDGEEDSEELAGLAVGRLRNKTAQLVRALEGRVRPIHRSLIRQILAHIDMINGQIDECTSAIEDLMRPFWPRVAHLDEVPGVDKKTIEKIIAEIGVDMSQFPSAPHLCSWACICPGNNESAGKRKTGKTRKGQHWLRNTLVEAAWAAVKTKDSYLSAQYHRLVVRLGKKKAIVSVAHSILTIIYHMLRDGTVYEDLGADFFKKRDVERLKRRYLRGLEGLGYQVALAPLEATG